MVRTATIERNSLTSASAKGMGAKTDLSAEWARTGTRFLPQSPSPLFIHDEAILRKVHQLRAVARSRCHASKHFLLDMASFAAACPRIAVMRMGAFLKHQVRGVRFLPTFLSLAVVVKNLRPSSKQASVKRKRGPVAALDVPQIETQSNFFSTCSCDASIWRGQD